MLTNEQSKYYFIFGCLPIRILMSLIPIYINKKLKIYYHIILLSISLSFLYLYFTNKRLDAFEAGGITWWSKFRIIHGLLYLFASIYLIENSNLSSKILFLDTLFGLIIFIINRNHK